MTAPDRARDPYDAPRIDAPALNKTAACPGDSHCDGLSHPTTVNDSHYRILDDEGGQFTCVWQDDLRQDHRADGPAIVINDENGTFLEWAWRGDPHRTDGPASVEHLNDGTTTTAWWVHGKRHNDQGPALVVVGADGSIMRREWWLHGTRCPERGPGLE